MGDAIAIACSPVVSESICGRQQRSPPHHDGATTPAQHYTDMAPPQHDNDHIAANPEERDYNTAAPSATITITHCLKANTTTPQ